MGGPGTSRWQVRSLLVGTPVWLVVLVALSTVGCDKRSDTGPGDDGPALDAGTDAAVPPDGPVGDGAAVDGCVADPVDALASDGAAHDAPADVQYGECPPDMVPVGRFCIDTYEAARWDATETTPGTDETKTKSVHEVVPWWEVGLVYGGPGLDPGVAATACMGAGKRLCAGEEWVAACSGAAGQVYPYGDTYEPATCLGIDTYCDCSACSFCTGTCPCEFCYRDGQCTLTRTGVMPTGSFPRCVSPHGAFDLAGNVWELTSDGYFRGGAWNCINSKLLHRCTHASYGIQAEGFRCCTDRPTL